MANKQVLVIEDDPDIGNLLSVNLQQEYDVRIEADGRNGYLEAVNGQYDVIILDLTLPEMNGLEVCKQLRFHDINTPIIMLTAKTEEVDKILGLEIGADDYITKPFSLRELSARIKAVLRRGDITKKEIGLSEKDLIQSGDILLDKNKMSVTIKGERVDLTKKEFELLRLFIENPGKTFSRQRLLNLVWGFEFEGYEHTVNSHINRLRMKIENDIKKPSYILTTWGVGYRFGE